MLRFLNSIRKSSIAFALCAMLGLLSMGALGYALYYPVAPILSALFPGPDAWHGDWVWPAAIAAGMLFAPAFLLAGSINLLLSRRGHSVLQRRFIYALVLWLWALLLWWLILFSNPLST